jgi:hypothetical protein
MIAYSLTSGEFDFDIARRKRAIALASYVMKERV